jgi:hypothetical protein
MKPRKSFLLRISPDLFEALERWSQQEMRSVNGQIEYLLKDAVVKRDRKMAERIADVDSDIGRGSSAEDAETSSQ